MTIRSYFLCASALLLCACNSEGFLKADTDDLEAEFDADDNGNLDIADAWDDVKAKMDEFDVEFTMVNSRYDATEGRFIERTPSIHKRNLFSTHTIDDKIYVIGGLNEDGNYVDTFERYDPETDTWEDLPPWSRPGFAYVLVVGRHLCAIGGYQNLKEPIRTGVDCYDVDEGSWSEAPDVPESYSSFAPVSLGGRVYVLGGSDSTLSLMSTSWIFNPRENAWSKGARMPSPRALAGVQAVGGKIYVTGGFGPKTFHLAEEDSDAPQDRGMLVYDPAADSWATAPDMPHARALYGLDGVDGMLTVFFGLTNGPLVEFYDPSTRKWRGGTDPEMLPSGGVYTYAKFDEKVHLLAVADGVTATSLESSGSLWRYDLEADQWAKIARREEGTDALFQGAPTHDAIHWIGAHTLFIVPSP